MSQYQGNCQQYSIGTLNQILPYSSPVCQFHMVESQGLAGVLYRLVWEMD